MKILPAAASPFFLIFYKTVRAEKNNLFDARDNRLISGESTHCLGCSKKNPKGYGLSVITLQIELYAKITYLLIIIIYLFIYFLIY